MGEKQLAVSSRSGPAAASSGALTTRPDPLLSCC